MAATPPERQPTSGTSGGLARRALGSGLAAAVLLASACSATAPTLRDDPAPPVSYAGTRLPTPEPLRRDGEPAPPRRDHELDPPGPGGAAPGRQPDAEVAPPPAEFSDALRNAARRDEETERVTRHYLSMLSTMAQIAAARAAHQTADSYDPVPVMRLHAQLAPELGMLAARAGILQRHWAALAGQLGLALPPAVGSSGQDREGRVRLLVATCGCIRHDAAERMAHGAVWQTGHDAGLDDAVIRKREGTPQRYLADMEQLARTVDCSQRALEVLRRN